MSLPAKSGPYEFLAQHFTKGTQLAYCGRFSKATQFKNSSFVGGQASLGADVHAYSVPFGIETGCGDSEGTSVGKKGQPGAIPSRSSVYYLGFVSNLFPICSPSVDHQQFISSSRTDAAPLFHL